MSTPGEYYRSLPPVSKFYGIVCLMTTAAYELDLIAFHSIMLDYEAVFKRFQVWRLITNFFFLAAFSFRFAFLFISILRYSVKLERGTFDKRTADYVCMFLFGALSLLVTSVIPYLRLYTYGPSMVFMIIYVWSRETPNATVAFYDLVRFKAFYLPWLLLVIEVMIGFSMKPALLGIVIGHLYYFLTVLYPLSGGKFHIKTPLFVHKLVARWGEGAQMNSPVPQDPHAEVAFRGRSYRLNGTATSGSTPRSSSSTTTSTAQQSGSGEGVAFRGRSYRLDR